MVLRVIYKAGHICVILQYWKLLTTPQLILPGTEEAQVIPSILQHYTATPTYI